MVKNSNGTKNSQSEFFISELAKEVSVESKARRLLLTRYTKQAIMIEHTQSTENSENENNNNNSCSQCDQIGRFIGLLATF